MKKILLIILLLSVVLNVVACANPGNNIMNQGDHLDEGVNILNVSSKENNSITMQPQVEEEHQGNFEETNVLIEEQPCGGAELCPIHPLEFHSYNYLLISYVGNENFAEWVETNSNLTSTIEGCPYYGNIYRFIQHFDIPREVFEANYYGTPIYYYEDHNVELLYGENENAVNQYYMSYVEREEEREKFSSLGDIKIGIVEYARLSAEENMKVFYETHCKDKMIVDWSIADFVRTTGIKKKDLQDLIGDITVQENPGMTIVLECFDFDYDILYSDTTLMKKTTADESVVDKHNEDMNFCRQPQLSVGVAVENESVD